MKLIKRFYQSLKNSIKSKIFKDVYKKIDEQKFLESNIFFQNRSKSYKLTKNLDDVDFKVFSQNGEDGILDFIINQMNIKLPKFVEIGVGDFSECNTRFIYKKNYSSGLIIDVIKNFSHKVSLVEDIWRGGLVVLEKRVNASNINKILRDQNFNIDIDIFSIDIDGIDYWVLKSLPINFSKIVVAEYNPYFGDKLNITVPNLEDFDRNKYHYSELCFGCSLTALIKLMKQKKMTFIGTNLFRNNAFFINDEYLENFNLDPIDYNNLKKYTEAKFLESKDMNKKKSYIKTDMILNKIKDCEVMNLNNNKIFKISELIK